MMFGLYEKFIKNEVLNDNFHLFIYGEMENKKLELKGT
jgi:hypothetical protein